MDWHLLAAVLAVALFLFDFQNILSWSRRRTLGPAEDGCTDFTIVVPIYGDPRYFDSRDNIRPWIGHVLVVIDVGNAGMESFAGELEQEGWRVLRLQQAHPTPPSLIQEALPYIDTEYVLRMDADTRPLDDIARFVESMRRDGADICSVKIRVAGARTRPEKMQDLEYQMAMLSRHFRPWLTSGACMIVRHSALMTIFAKHSMWFPGEDIETGRIAHALRLRIRHLDMTVETDAPDSWIGLFRQRRLWWAGAFRHTIVNLDRNALHLPVWSFYYVALVWVGVYFKWHTLVSYLQPFVLIQTLAFLFVVYSAITVVANWQVRSWRMLVFPPYALAQAILMPIVGSIYYVTLARRQCYLGRYRFGYRRLRTT